MSSDDDKCFQCQETGHMAHYCPHIKCFLTVMIMAMLQQTAPTKFHPQVYQHDAETTTLEDMIDSHLRVTITIGFNTVIIEIGTGSADLNLTPIILDIGVTVADPHTAAHHATEA